MNGLPRYHISFTVSVNPPSSDCSDSYRSNKAAMKNIAGNPIKKSLEKGTLIICIRVGLFQFSLVRNREFLTAFPSSACQHFTSVGSFHTLTETMYRFSSAIMWLKCTFHCN